MSVDIARVTGREILPLMPAVAALRIAVFREYPYLYEGSTSYEQIYLADYAASPQAVVIVARDGEMVVGAATALPLTAAHVDDVVPPLLRAGYDPQRVFYFGESVLDPAYRGRGIGGAFLDGREAHARALGFATATFCAVVRPPDHRRRPAGYRPLDDMWAARGFVRRPDITTTFSWRDLDESAESRKQMMFWTKELT